MEYVAVDLEMTGLKVTQDRILEIGAVKIRDGKLCEEFACFVNPHRSLSEEIIALTGITDEMVADAPEIGEALEAFLSFSGNAVLIGHNLMFDYSFLKQNIVNLGMTYERKGLDTLKIARAVLPAEEKKDLCSLRTRFGLDCEHSHRALDDAKACAEIFLRFTEEYGETQKKLFLPGPLHYKVKKRSPITVTQKRDLNHLFIYHKIVPNMDISYLTRSEASKLIERIHKEYGRIPKEEI